MRTYDDGGAAMLRVPQDADLLEALTEAAKRLGIEAGTVHVIGAVKKLVLGYYDQDAREYRLIEPDGHFEIAAGVGNVSLKEGEPFIHVHLVCSGEDGSALGGHLKEGTVTYVAEASFRRFAGEPPVRAPDPGTGLDLWPTD